MDIFSNETSKGCTITLVIIFIICCSIIIGKYYHNKNNNIIEQDVELQKHNDSLKIEVNNFFICRPFFILIKIFFIT